MMQWTGPSSHRDGPLRPPQSPRMELLLLAALVATGLCGLPAPLHLTMASFNFKHRLHWKAAPGSPPGLTYHVYASNTESKEVVASSNELWADVELEDLHDSFSLSVQSRSNTSSSPFSKSIRFTPYLDTVITAPNVTVSGCGKCIWLNISLPEGQGEAHDLKKFYKKMTYSVSWQREGQDTVTSTETTNQSVIIKHLLPHTQYCVQVRPKYLEINFQPSPWKCVFSSSSQPPREVAVVAIVTVFVLLGLSAVILVLFGLQYTGIMCKVKEALPHPLHKSSWQRSLLRLERTLPEPLSLLPGTGRRLGNLWDQDEDEQEPDPRDQRQDQDEDQYMNRCPDLSSDSSSGCGPRSSSCQSTASAISYSQRPTEAALELKEDHVVNKESWRQTELYDDDEEEWHKELEKYESVNLTSVTITALQL